MKKNFSTIQELEKNIDVGTLIHHKSCWYEFTALVLSKERTSEPNHSFVINGFVLNGDDHFNKSFRKIISWQVGAAVFYEIIF